MSKPSYQQFCPVAMASEILCRRWTLLLLRELVTGSTRFNDLRRGLPKMSPSLLSQRLKELEEVGLIIKQAMNDQHDTYEYHLSESGKDIQSVLHAVGVWGQKWVKAGAALENVDPRLLMWDMRRCINPEPLPDRRIVVQFYYPEVADGKKKWWLEIDRQGRVDLCWSDPGYEIDLIVETDLQTMTSVWMGLTSIKEQRDKIKMMGSKQLAKTIQTWLGLSPFAKYEKLA
jgi:DNA-binding HxlR family transcriptional regulator